MEQGRNDGNSLVCNAATMAMALLLLQFVTLLLLQLVAMALQRCCYGIAVVAAIAARSDGVTTLLLHHCCYC
jgi:hypothetical protein